YHGIPGRSGPVGGAKGPRRGCLLSRGRLRGARVGGRNGNRAARESAVTGGIGGLWNDEIHAPVAGPLALGAQAQRADVDVLRVGRVDSVARALFIVFVGEHIDDERQLAFALVDGGRREADGDEVVVGLVDDGHGDRTGQHGWSGIHDVDHGRVLVRLPELIDHSRDVGLRAERLLDLADRIEADLDAGTTAAPPTG